MLRKDTWRGVRSGVLQFDPNTVRTSLFKLQNANASLKHVPKPNLDKKVNKAPQIDYVLSKNAFEIDKNEAREFHIYINRFYSNMAVGICAETKHCKLKSNCNIDGIYMIGLWDWKNQQVINYNPFRCNYKSRSRKHQKNTKIARHLARIPKSDDNVTFLFDFQSEEYNGCIRLIHTTANLSGDDGEFESMEINCYETKNCDVDIENYDMMPFVKNLKNLNIKQYKLIIMIPDTGTAISDINYNYNYNHNHSHEEDDELEYCFDILLDKDCTDVPHQYRWLREDCSGRGGWYCLLGTAAGSGNGMLNDAKWIFIKYPELDYGLGYFEGSFSYASYGIFMYIWTYIADICLTRICPQNCDVMRLIRTSLIVYSQAIATSNYPNKEFWHSISLLTIGLYSFHFISFFDTNIAYSDSKTLLNYLKNNPQWFKSIQIYLKEFVLSFLSFAFPLACQYYKQNCESGTLTDATKTLVQFYLDKVYNLYKIILIISGDIHVPMEMIKRGQSNIFDVNLPKSFDFAKSRRNSLLLKIKENKNLDLDLNPFINGCTIYNRLSQKGEHFNSFKYSVYEQLQCIELLIDNIADYNINDANDCRTSNILNINTRKKTSYRRWKNLTMLKQCQYCHAKDRHLRKCKGCRKVFYCSALCQKKDWNLKHHKNVCHK